MPGPAKPVALLTGAFTGTGQSQAVELFGGFNLTLSGTFVGTVRLRRSFDNGATWFPVSRDTAGNEASYTAPASLVANEPENGVLYQLECTAFTSGTINYRLSR